MKATIEDLDILQAIQPQQVATYLQASGWRESKQISDRASVWVREGNSEQQFQLLLPLKRELEDFPLRMSKVLQTLETAEKRSQLQILKDFTTSSADVIRIRLNHPNLKQGSIPIQDGIHFFERAKDMMMSAACSTVEPKGYFDAQKPKQAIQYIEKLRLGQTEQVGYTITLISPINIIHASSLSQDFFERQVIKTLAYSIEFISKLAEKIKNVDELKNLLELVHKGVSANMCEALVGMDKSGKKTGLEISFNWSPMLTAPENAPRTIFLSPEKMPFIENMGKKLKQKLSED